ncbi:MAG: prepilin-type N-terminal cleavage/methylation domain-containing protein [Sedimentisphaerales bacterium]
MKYKLRKSRAFTLIELMVALGIMVIVILFASEIFKVSIDSHRTALANAEIMQKLRAITGQLDSDFSGLDKDGEIFAVWKAVPLQNNKYVDNDFDGYERFDRIMFFASGDFQADLSSAWTIPYENDRIRGNVARICYMIAKDGTTSPEAIDKSRRILARSQHILTDNPDLAKNFDPNSFTPQQWFEWNNYYQYDKISLEEWKRIPLVTKLDMLSVICDTRVIAEGIPQNSNISEDVKGVSIDKEDPNSMHMLLCDGVGEFKIQGWDDEHKVWLPEVDPNGDGNLSDTNFFMDDSNNVPGVIYSPPFCSVAMNNVSYQSIQADRDHFNMIPGLGRALKFTFTLFDSKGIIKGGRTFTHIVYLDR